MLGGVLCIAIRNEIYRSKLAWRYEKVLSQIFFTRFCGGSNLTKIQNEEKYKEKCWKTKNLFLYNYFIIPFGDVFGVFRGLLNRFFMFGTTFGGFWRVFCTTDLGISRFTRNSPNLEDLYPRAQEELEARKTCVVTPGTWFKRRKNPIEKIFSQKKLQLDN